MLVIGCGGSGKSTLAIELGRILGIPIHHLDRLFWKPDWVPSDAEEFQERLVEVLKGDAWIMDGNYGGSLPMRVGFADTIVFLDLPTVTCLVGATRRLWEYRGRSRPDMTESNTERINFEFLNWILTYRRSRRPKVMAMLEKLKESKEILILKSRKDVSELLDRLELEQQLT